MISISVIIPIYNVEQYVKRCLESVLIQEECGAGIECIIVNDCTPDNSMCVIHHLLERYNGSIRFTILEHKVNRGLSATRNTGLLSASGDFIFFIDSDDYIMPNSFRYFIDNLKRYPDTDMLIGNVKNCKGDNFLIHHIKEPWLIDDRNVFVSRMLHHQIYLYAWNKLIRRDLIIKNQVFFEEGILYEDQCWSYKLFSHVSSVLLLPKVTYFYEYNQNSIVNTTFTSDQADKVVRSYTVSINKILDNPPSPSRYNKNLTVDYLLFMANFLMNGIDVQSHFKLSNSVANDFHKVRVRILSRSLCYGRLMLSCFFMLLFPPLCHLQKLRLFRHHYYDIESVVNMLCHLTDFLHSKDRI